MCGFELIFMVLMMLAGCGQKDMPVPAETPPPPQQVEQPQSQVPSPSPAPDSGADTQTPPAADPSANVPETGVSGSPQSIPSTLFTGDSYSIYIPDTGWKREHEGADDGALFTDTWESVENDDVELEVAFYPGKSVADVTAFLIREEDDYHLTEKDGALRGIDPEDNECLTVYLHDSPKGCFAVSCAYPADLAGDFGVKLAAIAGTFTVIQKSMPST